GGLARAQQAAPSAPPGAAPTAPAPEVARSVTRTITIGGAPPPFFPDARRPETNSARSTGRAILLCSAHLPHAPATEGARPSHFAFNGGPGAASVYLHLGAMGPRRAAIGPQGTEGAPPVVDNAETWLGLGDLVFVDPVGTGLSRATMTDGSAGEQEFWE